MFKLVKFLLSALYSTTGYTRNNNDDDDNDNDNDTAFTTTSSFING